MRHQCKAAHKMKMSLQMSSRRGGVGSGARSCLAGAASLQDIRTRGDRGGRGVSVTRVPLIR